MREDGYHLGRMASCKRNIFDLVLVGYCLLTSLYIVCSIMVIINILKYNEEVRLGFLQYMAVI